MGSEPGGDLEGLCSDVQRMVAEAESGTPSIDKMVEMYYTVSNFVTVANMLEQEAGNDAPVIPADDAPAGESGLKQTQLTDNMIATKQLVSERFDPVIHPRIKSVVSGMIRDTVDDLRAPSPKRQQPPSQQPHDTATTATESANNPKVDSAKYDLLRTLMSVKEFIEQYDAMVVNNHSRNNDRVTGSAVNDPQSGGA